MHPIHLGCARLSLTHKEVVSALFLYLKLLHWHSFKRYHSVFFLFFDMATPKLRREILVDDDDEDSCVRASPLPPTRNWPYNLPAPYGMPPITPPGISNYPLTCAPNPVSALSGLYGNREDDPGNLSGWPLDPCLYQMTRYTSGGIKMGLGPTQPQAV